MQTENKNLNYNWYNTKIRTYCMNYHEIVLKSCQIVDQGNHSIFKSTKTSWDKLFISV